MSCQTHYTLKTIGQECGRSVGGIETVYILDRSDLKFEIKHDIDPESKECNGEFLIGITAGTTVVDTPDDFAKISREFQFHKNTASMTTETDVPDDADPLFNTTLSMVFSKMEQAKRLALMGLVMGNVAALVKTSALEKDKEGVATGKHVWFLLGKDSSLRVSALGGETGTVYTDKNQYTVSLLDNAEELPYVVEGGLINKLGLE